MGQEFTSPIDDLKHHFEEFENLEKQYHNAGQELISNLLEEKKGKLNLNPQPLTIISVDNYF
jgi:hypothetical protein